MKILSRYQVVIKKNMMSADVLERVNWVLDTEGYKHSDSAAAIYVDLPDTVDWDTIATLKDTIKKQFDQSSDEELQSNVFERQISSFAPTTESESKITGASTFIFFSDRKKRVPANKANGMDRYARGIPASALFKAKYADSNEVGYYFQEASINNAAYISIRVVSIDTAKKNVRFHINVLESRLMGFNHTGKSIAYAFTQDIPLIDDENNPNHRLNLDASNGKKVDISATTFQPIAESIIERSGWGKSKYLSRCLDSFVDEVDYCVYRNFIDYLLFLNGRDLDGVEVITPDNCEHDLIFTTQNPQLYSESAVYGKIDEDTRNAAHISFNDKDALEMSTISSMVKNGDARMRSANPKRAPRDLHRILRDSSLPKREKKAARDASKKEAKKKSSPKEMGEKIKNVKVIKRCVMIESYGIRQVFAFSANVSNIRVPTLLALLKITNETTTNDIMPAVLANYGAKYQNADVLYDVWNKDIGMDDKNEDSGAAGSSVKVIGEFSIFENEVIDDVVAACLESGCTPSQMKKKIKAEEDKKWEEYKEDVAKVEVGSLIGEDIDDSTEATDDSATDSSFIEDDASGIPIPPPSAPASEEVVS